MGTQPDSAQQIGFAVALVAIVLISLASGKIEGTSGLGMAVTAGIGFGIYFILMSFIQSDSVYWLAAVSRALTFGMLLMIVIRQRRILVPPNGLTGVMLLLAGVLDVFGNIFFLLSAQSGRLDIAAVVVGRGRGGAVSRRDHCTGGGSAQGAHEPAASPRCGTGAGCGGVDCGVKKYTVLSSQ